MSFVAGTIQWLWQKCSESNRSAEAGHAGASATTGGRIPQEPVVVWKAANPMEAQIVQGRLRSAGIPAIVRGEAMGRIYGFVYGGLAQRDVLAPGPLAETAQAILSEEVEWESDSAHEG